MDSSLRGFQKLMTGMSSLTLFKHQLSESIVVDVGRLEQLYKGGSKGLVQMFNDSHEQVCADICLPGGIGSVDCGQLGFVIIPRTAVDVQESKIDKGLPAYSTEYAKFIPFEVSGGTEVVMGSAGDGLSIGSSEYTLMFDKQSIELSSKKLQCRVNMETGSFQICTNKAQTNIYGVDDTLTIQLGEKSRVELAPDTIKAQLGETTKAEFSKTDAKIEFGETTKVEFSKQNTLKATLGTTTIDANATKAQITAGDITLSGTNITLSATNLALASSNIALGGGGGSGGGSERTTFEGDVIIKGNLKAGEPVPGTYNFTVDKLGV